MNKQSEQIELFTMVAAFIFLLWITFWVAYQEYFIVGMILAIVLLIGGQLLSVHWRKESLTDVFARRSTYMLLGGLLAFVIVAWKPPYPDHLGWKLPNGIYFLQVVGILFIWLGTFFGGLILPLLQRLPSSNQTALFAWRTRAKNYDFWSVVLGFIVGSGIAEVLFYSILSV